MASSPTDPVALTGPTDPEQTIKEIASCYESAIAALDRSDLDRVGQIMDRVDGLTRSLGVPRPIDAESMEHVTRLHSRLMAALTAAHSQAHAAIQKSSKGRKALRSYGNRAETKGTRIESVT